MLEMLEIEPRQAANCAVIWLHGLGADGNDFVPLVHQYELGARFVLPHAPQRPVTLNNGMVMRAWYDISGLAFSQGQGEDSQGIEQARQHLLSLIQRERERGLTSDRILLAGFSQGGAVALHTALRFAEPLAGVLVLSAYLPLADLLAREKRADPSLLTIERDPVVPFVAAERSRAMLEEQGYHVDFNTYSMEHSLCPPQMESLRYWIAGQLG